MFISCVHVVEVININLRDLEKKRLCGDGGDNFWQACEIGREKKLQKKENVADDATKLPTGMMMLYKVDTIVDTYRR